MNNYLQDSNGNKSAKRLWGSLFLTATLLLGIFITIYDVFYNVEMTVGLKVMETLGIIGGSLIGIGTFENLLGKK